MRVLYFDCFCGVSGDMILGSLLDLGADEQEVRSGLDSVGLAGYELTVEPVVRGSLAATNVTVVVTDQDPTHRHLHDIESMIDSSTLSESVKQGSKTVFRRLAETEARIHNTTPDRIHFHEVGATDSIVDVVGSLIALDTLQVAAVHSSPVHVGTGEVRCEHGTLPVPAPATVELLRGVPVYSQGIRTELSTPTGAALITTMSRSFGPMPPMTIEAVGYGAGRKQIAERPNVLRAILGETAGDGAETDMVAVLETTIDDMNPEQYPWLVDRLLEAGVKDVYLVPAIGKGGRPATSVVVICDAHMVERVATIIFEETSSFGLRYRFESRLKLSREFRQVQTQWGPVRVKIGTISGKTVSISPEFRDCRDVAEQNAVPLKRVYEAARAAAKQIIEGNEA
jgi:uncharacterized protein (TIGR00299 family) protein